MFKRNHRRYQLTWKGPTLLTPEEHHKQKIRTLQLHLDYVLIKNTPTRAQKSKPVQDAAFDSDYLPILLGFKIRFTRETEKFLFNRKSTRQVRKKKNTERIFINDVFINVAVRTTKKLCDADSFKKCIQYTTSSWFQEEGVYFCI
ncbi:hypothetical protein RB195_006855 [Necator americanus]|uniref:Uncharacterized protein n=1 Tax=Necator americanus TaxID=51031 RepID=A0ABR1BUL3_NECAM